MSRSRLKAWFQERVPVPWDRLALHLQEHVPVHLKGWFFALGGTPLILFIIMVITGIMLTFYYVPSPMHAYESVSQISYEIRFGWLIRGIHSTAANLMIFSILLHMIRVYVTRAYRRPRELNWMVGVLLLFVTMALAFTGYSLVYDQLSYWAATVGTALLADIPFIGEALLMSLRGGMDVSANTLTRFYSMHISLLPLLFVILLGVHITLIRLLGTSVPEGDKRTETYPFFPNHITIEAIIGFVLLIGITLWVIAFPPVLGDKADLFNTPDVIKPEWYFYPVFRWLKMVSIHTGLFTIFAFVIGLIGWPFVELMLNWLGQKIHSKLRLGYLTGVAAFIFILALVFIETVSH